MNKIFKVSSYYMGFYSTIKNKQIVWSYFTSNQNEKNNISMRYEIPA